MGKSQSKPDDSRDLKKVTTRRLKFGIKFGKDTDGGIEAGLACGFEKKVDRVYGKCPKTSDTERLLDNEVTEHGEVEHSDDQNK